MITAWSVMAHVGGSSVRHIVIGSLAAAALVGGLVLGGAALLVGLPGSETPMADFMTAAARGSRTATAGSLEGRELFVREWLPQTGEAGGDGLGPLFNETSCANCHNQGGVGGAGSRSKNVRLAAPDFTTPNGHPTLGPAFVVHHHSTDPDYENWVLRSRLAPDSFSCRTLDGESYVFSHRNTTSLFGAGLIESIDPEVLMAASQRRYPDLPEVTGRVALDAKGRPGRFGWKAQLASLDEFVQTACAVELGLNVPQKEQGRLRHRVVHTVAGLDLSSEECAALTDFVRRLPPPPGLRPQTPEGEKYLAAGAQSFAAIGCATCHTPKLGEVDGIYSDLLLHDLGPDLTDRASSYGGSPQLTHEISRKGEPVVAQASEWRTPPLWGVRDSAPYLHHGFADTLDQAIIAHGGEATRSREAYQALSHHDRLRLVAFLKSLGAVED